MTSPELTAVRVWIRRRSSQWWFWSRSALQVAIERLASETLRRPAVKRVLVSGVGAMLTFVVGSIAWIDLNSHLTPRDGRIVAGVREFTLWPVLWVAVAVFVATWSLSAFIGQANRGAAGRGRSKREGRDRAPEP
jgi:hypothetical protein